MTFLRIKNSLILEFDNEHVAAVLGTAHMNEKFNFTMVSVISSKDFLILPRFFSLYNVDMVTSKYCIFGYASMCGNI